MPGQCYEVARATLWLKTINEYSVRLEVLTVVSVIKTT